jgi:hypothetical protein
MPLDALQLMQGYRSRDLANMAAQQRMDIVPQELAMRQEAAQRQKALADLQGQQIMQKVQQGRQLAAYQYATLASRDMDRASRERIATTAAATKANAPAKLDDESAQNLAVESLYDPNATVGFRRDPTTMGQIMKHRTDIMKEGGITPQDVVSGRAGFKADTLSLNKMTPQYDAVSSFMNTAQRNGRILTELADKVDSTGSPVIERWLRAGRRNIAGDADVSNFNAQIHLYGAEVARILTQPTLSGILTDTARKEVQDFLPNNATAKQIKSLVDLLERDFGNRQQTLESQIGQIRGRMSKRVAPNEASQSIAQPTASPPAPPAATRAVNPVDALLEKYK